MVAIDADTRMRDAAEAKSRIRRAFGGIDEATIAIKTIDSTLRGHIVAELEAALEASGRELAVVAPAFPDEHRITCEGVQYVDGVPLADSPFAADPTHPVRTSSLLELLAPLDATRLSAEEPRSRVTVADALRQDDLDKLVQRLPLDKPLWVGSPGLCHALARATRGEFDDIGGGAPLRRQRGPTLLVVGSMHPVSSAQLAALAQAGVPLVDAGTPDLGSRTGDLAIASPRMLDTRYAVDALARVVAPLIVSGVYGRVVLTGGATARAVVDQCNIAELEVLGEILPGVVVTSADDACDLIVKAGGFGTANLLVDLAFGG